MKNCEFFPADGSKISASQFMESLFHAHQQYTPLANCGGEKRRLNLLSVLFRNPNFLVLDEPTNDLDLQTLRTVEEFLAEFQGCLLIVSHDRYFMDRLVDHLFAFEGNGEIRDFPGNYSQYRNEISKETASQPERKEETVAPRPKPPALKNANKLSYNEKRELEMLSSELPGLEKEKKELESKLSQPDLAFEDLQKASERISEILSLIDKKEMRWLELSVIENPS